MRSVMVRLASMKLAELKFDVEIEYSLGINLGWLANQKKIEGSYKQVLDMIDTFYNVTKILVQENNFFELKVHDSKTVRLSIVFPGYARNYRGNARGNATVDFYFNNFSQRIPTHSFNALIEAMKKDLNKKNNLRKASIQKKSELKFEVDRFVSRNIRDAIPYDLKEYYDREMTFKEFKKEVQKTISHIENVTLTYVRSLNYNMSLDKKNFHDTYDLILSVKKAGKTYGNVLDVDISFAKKDTAKYKFFFPSLQINVLYSLTFKENIPYEKLVTVKNLL